MKNNFTKTVLLMSKLTLYVFFVISITLDTVLANESTAQIKSVREVRVNLKLEKASLKEAFELIEQQTQFRFSVSWEKIEASEPVNLNVSNASVEEVLLELSRNNKLEFRQVNNNISVNKLHKNQAVENVSVTIINNIDVSGVVLDENGEPLPGATIIIQGTNEGTTTDVEGKFRLSCPEDATLIVSFVGYKPMNVAVNNRTSIEIQLDMDQEQLDEVVVVGYGTQKKVNLTGAVSVVEGEDLVNRPAVGAADALQGFMPGVTVTKSSGSPGDEEFNIQIRGLTSVNNNPVLILVDGIEGSLEDVRPEDIESISVLKDASAASIYGAKAAGGVILVTTKGGQKGKIQVDYNSYYSFSKAARLPERLNSYEIAEALNVATINAGGNAVVSEEILTKLRDPNILYEIDPDNPNQYLYYGNYDDVDVALKNFTPIQSHNVSLSGGSDKITYRLSGTYYKNDGILKIGYDNNEKYTGRLNLDTKINDYISFSNNLSYSRNVIEKPAGTTRLTQSGNGLESRNALFSDIFQSPGVSPLYDPNGYYTYGNRMGGFDARNRLLDHIYDVGLDERDQNNIRVNSQLTIENFVDGLRLRLIGVTDANFNNSVIHEKPIYEHNVDGTLEDTPVIAHNSIYKDQTKSSFKELQALIDYKRTFAQNHNFYVLAGYSHQDFRREFFSAEAQALVNPNLADFNWASNDGIVLGDNVLTNAFQSVFGRVTYNFKERYLVEANFRYDGSSKLAPSDRYRLFPSASVGWRISEESWFDVPFISEFKIRASKGQLGNANVLGNYGFISTLNVADQLILSDAEQRAQYVFQGNLASESLSWETVESSDIGFDLGLLDDKLSITGDYFVKRNKDMLAPVTYPSVLGVDVNVLNAGELKSWGWELSATWRHSNTKNFNYWVSANLSDNQNELVKYLGADVISPGTNAYIQGLPVNTIWGYKSDGLFQTQTEVDEHAFQNGKTGPGDLVYVDLNGDDVINSGAQTLEDHGDLVNLGNTNPRYNFGVRGGFNWNNFDFMIFLQGVGKRTAMMDNFAIMPYFRPWLHPQRHHMDYWSEDNPDAFWPRLYARGEHNYLPSEKWVQNAAYVRLKDLQIGYTIPSAIVNRVGIERLRFYFAGRDLWEMTKTFDFIDPEMPNGATFMYPFTRKYTFGVNLTF